MGSLKGMVAAVNASGALLAYLKEELSLPISHIRSIHPYTIREALTIDPNTSTSPGAFRKSDRRKSQANTLGSH